jgi:hypothetical protein
MMEVNRYIKFRFAEDPDINLFNLYDSVLKAFPRLNHFPNHSGKAIKDIMTQIPTRIVLEIQKEVEKLSSAEMTKIMEEGKKTYNIIKL